MLGGAGHEFVGSFETRGCYRRQEGADFYTSGVYEGRAYFGNDEDVDVGAVDEPRARLCKVEIHRSRTAEMQELPPWLFFPPSFHVCAALREILQNTFFESSKNIRFQKKKFKQNEFC